MSQVRPTRADREVLQFCKDNGIEDAEIRAGKKHRKLFIGGRMVHVLCHGNAYGGDRGLKFVFSTIRRIAQERRAQ